VLREPTLKEWGAAGAPLIPRSVDSRPPLQVACRLRLRRAGARERRRAGAQGTPAGGQCANDRLDMNWALYLLTVKQDTVKDQQHDMNSIFDFIRRYTESKARHICLT